jgi:4-hydroxy-tetrahydrodipicolinate synthase
VRFWLEGGVSGLAPCGSNGEGPYLSREERKKIIKTVVDEVNGKVPVVAGTGSMSTKETILFTEDARDLGADAALVVTPYYFKLSGREMHEHYKTLCEAVDLPIVLYSVPKFTSYFLEPALIQQLASECKNIVGVKDSGGSISTITETIRLVGDRIAVLAGTADVILPTLMIGGKGAIVAVANAYPKMCAELYDAFKRGDFKKASSLQRQIAYLNDVLVKKYNQLSSIKEAMKLLGLPAGYPRRPALPLKDDEKSDIAKALKAMPEPQ